MVDESILAKIDAFLQELKEEGVEDVVFAGASSDGFMAVKYDGNPKAILYLVRTLDLNIMFDSMQEMVMEVAHLGREDNGE
tara:strand:- start:149 stop:391 length:243 start_codon:yes stop_codon:yes gene_type:complete